MATIQEIADLAGVSRGTVDRVFNGRGHVSEKTAAAIWDAASKLGYVPKRAAKSVSSVKGTLHFGYIIYKPETISFFDDVLTALEQKVLQFRQLGINVTIHYNNASDPSYQDTLLRQLGSEHVDGIIFCGMDRESTTRIIDDLWKKGIPVITVLTDIPRSSRLAYIGCNAQQVGRVTGELMSMICPGRMDVGVLMGSNEIQSQFDRITGFQQYIKELSSRASIVNVSYNNLDDFESYYLVKELLAKQPNVNVLLLATVWVYGACRAVKELPPEKRPSVFCFDETESTRKLLKKGLITAIISRPFQFQAEKALDVLFGYVISNHLHLEDTSYTNVQILLKENLL